MQVLKNMLKEVAYTPSRVLCYFGSKFPHSEKKVPFGEIKRILIIYSGGSKLGDVILSTAAIRSLREEFPSSYIAMLVNTMTKDVVMYNPNLDEVLVTKYFNFKRFLTLLMFPSLRRKIFDLVIILDPSFTYRLLAFSTGIKYRVGLDVNGNGFLLTTRVEYPLTGEVNRYSAEGYLDILRVIGINSNNNTSEIFVPNEVDEAMKKALTQHGIQATDLKICIHPGSGGVVKELKRWPNENFAKLSDMLIEKHNAKIIFLSGSSETRIVKEIISMMKNKPVDFNNETDSVIKLAGLIKNCDVLICHDSAPMHIGAAVGTPTVALFGPTKPIMWAPVGEKHAFIKKDVSCGPCYDAYPRVFKGCSDNICMKLITPEEVFEVINKIIQVSL